MFLTRATILFVLFAAAVGHYYYWHMREQILAAERNVYFNHGSASNHSVAAKRTAAS